LKLRNLLTRMYRRVRRAIIPEISESYALDNLDLKLLKYLNFKRGFFVEAGANDGINQSNTLLFEKKLKWKGLLIEPIPELAEKCRLNRPNCIVENYALVPLNYPNKEIDMRYSNLMSLVKGAMRSEEEEIAHINRGCEIQSIETYDVKVPAINLTAILDRHEIKRIDLLSLDVEGFELEVLRGIDFKKYRPKFILIEARFKEEIEIYLDDLYIPIGRIGFYDILFKLRK
jgi:FkbM family methyltransferase